MIRAYRALVAFLDERERGEALALFRIGVGVALLVDLLATAPDGVLSAIWVDIHHGGYRPLGYGNFLVHFLGGPTPAVVWGLFAGTCVAGLALIVGFGGRITALVAAQGLIALSGLNGHTRGSYDALLSNLLWLLVLSASTATWSLDARILRGRWATDRLVPSWPRRVAIVQLVLVYFSTGLHKISAHWTPAGGFSAVYYIMQQPSWHRFDMTWLAYVYPLTQLGTAATWCFELFAPALLFVLWRERRRGRRGYYRLGFVGMGVLLHTGIFLFMEVGPFTVIIWSLYFCLFTPDEVRRLFDATYGLSPSRCSTNE